jgi:hypothetical protein
MEFIFGKSFEREILGLDMSIQCKDWILLALLQAVCECAVCKRTWVCSFAYQVYSVYMTSSKLFGLLKCSVSYDTNVT